MKWRTCGEFFFELKSPHQNLRERIGVLCRFAHHEFRLIDFRFIDLVVEVQVEQAYLLAGLLVDYAHPVAVAGAVGVPRYAAADDGVEREPVASR